MLSVVYFIDWCTFPPHHISFRWFRRRSADDKRHTAASEVRPPSYAVHTRLSLASCCCLSACSEAKPVVNHLLSRCFQPVTWLFWGVADRSGFCRWTRFHTDLTARWRPSESGGGAFDLYFGGGRETDSYFRLILNRYMLSDIHQLVREKKENKDEWQSITPSSVSEPCLGWTCRTALICGGSSQLCWVCSLSLSNANRVKTSDLLTACWIVGARVSHVAALLDLLVPVSVVIFSGSQWFTL